MNVTIDKIKTFLKKITNAQPDGTKITEKRRGGVWAFLSLSIFKIPLVFLLLIFIGHAIYELFRYDLVIESFETPCNMSEQQGYTGTVVAYRLQYYMDKIREELYSNESVEADSINMDPITWNKNVDTIQSERRLEIDVPTIGISLNAIISQVRRMMNLEQQRIGGDIVVKDGKLYFTLRIVGKYEHIIVFSNDDKNPEPVIEKAARHVFEIFEPLKIGLNYCFNKNDKNLINLINNRKKIKKIQFENKEKAVSLVLEACFLKNKKQYEQAFSKMEQAKKYDPKNWRINIQWARVLMAFAKEQSKEKKQFLKDAANQYEEAYEKKPKPWIYTDWGYQLIEQDFEQAIKKFEQAIVIAPDYGLAHALLGNVLLIKRKQYEEANNEYKKAVELNPNVASWVYDNWGTALANLGYYKEAIVQHEKAVERVLFVETSYYWGRERLAKFEKKSRFAWIYYKNWGAALLNIGEYKEATKRYKQAIDLKPNHYRIYYEWGKALAKRELYKDAIKKFKEAKNLNKTHIWNDLQLAYVLIQNKQPEKSLELCKAILEKPIIGNSQKAAAKALSGLALIALKGSEEAKKECEEARNIDEKEDWVYLCLGDIFIQQNKVKKAKEQYKKAVELKPEKALYHYKLGEVLLDDRIGKKEEAKEQYKKAVKLQPWKYCNESKNDVFRQERLTSTITDICVSTP